MVVLKCDICHGNICCWSDRYNYTLKIKRAFRRSEKLDICNDCMKKVFETVREKKREEQDENEG